MTKPPLSFDPFATHPFTNNNALSKDPAATVPPADPSKYPLPIPSSLTQMSSLGGATTNTLAHTSAKFQSPPSSTSVSQRSGIQAPQPKHHRLPNTILPARNSSAPSNHRSPPIFVPFQQDRSSPELEEILLRKQLSQMLGPNALGRESKQYDA